VYMLRMISQSMEYADGTPTDAVFFVYDGSELTGRWKDDFAHLEIHSTESKAPRLIMGFGPSSSGKTYWATNILKLMHNMDDSFPSQMLSVDGGRQREASVTYGAIVDAARKSGLSGISNLVPAGLASMRQPTLFETRKIQGQLQRYLTNLKRPNPLSLYVPLTLSSCTPGACYSRYKPFVKLTRDTHWIGLMIYQHRSHLKCPFDVAFKCRGCIEGGRARERVDGKKYSDTAYAVSLKNGRQEMLRSPYCRLEIHNSGGQTYVADDGTTARTQSILTEHPVGETFLLDGVQLPNCIYRRSGTD
jgi:hypothetical protein